MDDIVMRDLKPVDIEVIVEIAVAAWTPIYAFYRQEMGEDLFMSLYPNWKERKAGQVRKACDPQDRAMVCVAEKGGRVVGFITFYSDNASLVGEIGNNAVHPDFQGMGIGTKMYEHVFDRLRMMGMRFVKVWTGGDPSHAPARRAYEKVGFSIRFPHVEYYRKL